jgi:excisionase family DNA binding protein
MNSTANEPPRGLLSKAEALAMLGVSGKTLARLVKQGKLRAVKYGRTSPLRFRELDVRGCLEAHLTGQPSPGTAAVAASESNP